VGGHFGKAGFVGEKTDVAIGGLNCPFFNTQANILKQRIFGQD
jgi:hypothetical protein